MSMSLSQKLTDSVSVLTVLFDKWCASNNVKNVYEDLLQLVLLENFKNTLPERMVIFLNEQKPSTLAEAAVLAD